MDVEIDDIAARVVALGVAIATERLEFKFMSRDDAMQLIYTTVACGMLLNPSDQLAMCNLAYANPDSWSEELWTAYLSAAVSVPPPANSAMNYCIVSRFFPAIIGSKHALQFDKKLTSDSFRQVFSSAELTALVTSFSDDTAGVELRLTWAAAAALL